ncbi:hypothetical protein D3C77_627110 [compost metagenome]
MLFLNFKIRPLVHFRLRNRLEGMDIQKIGQDQLVHRLKSVSKLDQRSSVTWELDEHSVAGIVVGHFGL